VKTTFKIEAEPTPHAAEQIHTALHDIAAFGIG
jgi:hypothetical protein